MIKNVFITFLGIFLLLSLIKNYFEYTKNTSFYLSFKEEYEKSKNKNNSLKTAMVKSKDPYEIEKKIRNDLNLAKPGETVILVPEPSPTPVTITLTPQPVYQQWISVFFKN